MIANVRKRTAKRVAVERRINLKKTITATIDGDFTKPLPLYEVFDGERYTINVRPDGTDLSEYLSRQRRYAGSSLNRDAAAERIARQWRILETLAEQFPA